MARSCLFCENPANSKEHAFPDWISEIAPGEGNLKHGRGDAADSVHTEWTNSGFDIKVRQVCRDCNHGWMSDMEAKTRDLLEPMLLGTRTRPLSVPEQKRVATWVYKTAIMLALAHSDDERFVPKEDYRFLYEQRVPPEGTYVWIAAVATDLDGKNYSAGYSRPQRLDFWKSDGTSVEGHGYRLPFSILSLVCEVIRDPHGGKITKPRPLRDVWTRVRPISDGAWPPGRWLTPAHVFDLHNGRFIAG